MMRTSSTRRALSRSVSKPKPGPAKSIKPDTRLLDAEQFLLPTYKRQPVVLSMFSIPREKSISIFWPASP